VTVFLRVLDASVEEKPAELLRTVRELSFQGIASATSRRTSFERESDAFAALPGSPFAYWVSDTLRRVFTTNGNMTGIGGSTKCGLGTLDDFRFLRLWWESSSEKWVAFPKGGAFSPWYSPVPLTLDWDNSGTELKTFVEAKVGSASRKIQAQEFYFRPGLTWPRRTTSGFGIRVMPANCIFADKGPAAFVEGDTPDRLLALCALLNSQVFGYLVGVQLAAADAAARSYEVGLIQRTPVPDFPADDTVALARLARRAWSLKRTLDSTNETSHAFVLPPGANEKVTGLDGEAVGRELESIQIDIDGIAFRLYDVGSEDRAIIDATSKRSLATAAADEDAVDAAVEEDSDDDATQNGAPDVGSADMLFSWLVGVAFGRFDLRLATGKRVVPPEPEPFDPLPMRAPGMWPEGEPRVELPPDIMVDDAGHGDDIVGRVANAAAETGWSDPHDLRQWLAREFFPLHITMYSKSRRKAPIYWQLATPSASYSVWLYIHAFSKDTLFRVQNDYAVPKLAHEERRLELLTSELRDKATAVQRKELAMQEGFVEELRVFLEEVKRVTPLWNPNLDDGVIINFAPLWRLVPQHKSWQKELKSTWDALCEGKYDWAHLAMHLWPERVIPKCTTDRSLAIAHGLEDVFWVEGTDGKWAARKMPTRSIDDLVRERTSPAVKSALKSLLEAPSVAGNGSRARGRPRDTATATRGNT
jgi:hypothetical protein